MRFFNTLTAFRIPLNSGIPERGDFAKGRGDCHVLQDVGNSII
jgi:hypothetical protein